MANIVNAADDNNEARKPMSSDGRTSQSSVREMKIRRGDVGFTDPLAKKNKVDNKYFYSSKSWAAVNPDEIDKLAIKSNAWGWDKSAKTWLEGAEGRAAVKAIQEGTYQFEDPEHDFLWETHAGLNALEIDDKVLAFYDAFYRRLRGKPDFAKVYTPESFATFWNSYSCSRMILDIYAEQNGLSDEQLANLKKTLAFSFNKGYMEALSDVSTWYKEGGHRHFGALHYMETIAVLKNMVLSHRTIDGLLENLTPQAFMNMGICSDSVSSKSFHKKSTGRKMRRVGIEPVYRGVVNSDVVTLAEEYVENPEYFIDQADKYKATLGKAVLLAPYMKIEDIEVLTNRENHLYVPLITEVNFVLSAKQLSDLNNAYPNSWVVFDTMSHSVAFNCMDVKEAEAWSVGFLENHNSLVRQKARGFIQDFNLDSLTRIGPLYREGSDRNIQGEYYETNGKGGKELAYKGELFEFFGFSGITFGSTTALNARTAFVNSVYDTFRDIENVLHVDTKTLLSDRFAISYGASGRPPELAHYFYEKDSNTHTVNITYEKGYGSLGHELIHCIDNALGRKILKDCNLSIDGNHLTNNFLSGSSDMKQILKDNYPAAYELCRWITDPTSSYYKRSLSLESKNSDNLYWSTPCEMFARAGAVYFADKFEEIGWRNDFLSGNSNFTAINSEGTKVNPIPTKEEQAVFNTLMDNFIKEAKEKGLITEIPETNTQSLYSQRNPGEPDRYNVIVKEETSPLLHMLERKARAAKEPKLKINKFEPSELTHARKYIETKLPSLSSKWESLDVSSVKTIIEHSDDRKNKTFSFESR